METSFVGGLVHLDNHARLQREIELRYVPPINGNVMHQQRLQLGPTTVGECLCKEIEEADFLSYFVIDSTHFSILCTDGCSQQVTQKMFHVKQICKLLTINILWVCEK